jgi:tetratricopeptide (TPR) repeat protein
MSGVVMLLLLLQPLPGGRGSVSGGSVSQSPDAQAEGVKALEGQKYDAAAEWFEKAVQADPKDYGAHFHLALARSMLGRDREAIAGYERVLELKPGLYQANLNLGILLLRQKEPQKALTHLEAAAREKPKEFRPNYYLGEALFAAGDFARAATAFEQALALDPKSDAAGLGQGRALARMGKLDEAAGHYQKAAAADARNRDALLELAQLYEAAKRPADAAAIYQQFPENAAARERLGELLLESGKTEDAIPQLEEAVRKSPTAANRLALATAYLRMKQPEKAVPLLEQATAAEPQNFELRMIYGRALRDQRNFRAAAGEFVRAAEQKPDSHEAWNELAAMFILMEDYPRALAALDRLRALGAETAAHHYFRAIVLDRMKQYKPALESYMKFLSMSEGKHPDEEFKARQRVRIIKQELSKR